MVVLQIVAAQIHNAMRAGNGTSSAKKITASMELIQTHAHTAARTAGRSSS
jgi:hypothetical protein